MSAVLSTNDRGPVVGLDESDFIGVDDHLDPVPQLQLGENPHDVRFHGRFGKHDPIGNFRVGEPFCHVQQDLVLATGKPSQPRISRLPGTVRVGQPMCVRVQEASRHAGGNDSVSAVDRSDGGDEVGRREVLQEKTARSGAQRAVAVLVKVEGSQDQDARPAAGVDDAAGGLDARDSCTTR